MTDTSIANPQPHDPGLIELGPPSEQATASFTLGGNGLAILNLRIAMMVDLWQHNGNRNAMHHHRHYPR